MPRSTCDRATPSKIRPSTSAQISRFAQHLKKIIAAFMDPPVSISTEREREREIGKMREKEREEELGSRRRRTFSPLAAVCISNRFGAEYISKIPSRSRRLRFYLSNGSFITRSANDRSFCYFTRASLESPSRGGSIFHTIEKVRSCGARARTRHRVLAGLGEYRGERASEEQKIRKLR